MLLLAVGTAGALGALARYGISVAALRWWGLAFPWGTLLVNLAGCFALGFLSEWALGDHGLRPETRAVLGAGFLGAFTTFSTFGVETLRAIQAGEWGVALANVAANVLLGLALAAFGLYLAGFARGAS